MPPITHLRPPLGSQRPNNPDAHTELNQVKPALEAAGTLYTVGSEDHPRQGSEVALPVPGKERPTPQPTTGARTAHVPSTTGLRRLFGHLFSDGTSTAGTHGMIAAGAASAPSEWTPWQQNVNTFRLSPQPWDTQYVAGVQNGEP